MGLLTWGAVYFAVRERRQEQERIFPPEPPVELIVVTRPGWVIELVLGFLKGFDWGAVPREH